MFARAYVVDRIVSYFGNAHPLSATEMAVGAIDAHQAITVKVELDGGLPTGVCDAYACVRGCCVVGGVVSFCAGIPQGFTTFLCGLFSGKNVAAVQFAVLHTNVHGQRRVRVSTLTLNSSTDAHAVIRSADVDALVVFRMKEVCVWLVAGLAAL